MANQYFIYPFVIGTIYLVIALLYNGIIWITGLSKIDKLRLLHFLTTKEVFISIKEIFREGLIHKRIFRKNKLLGYMHMSLAFGWFLLIIVGHIEAMINYKSFSVPFYKAVFLRYFETGSNYLFASVFALTMDLLLLFVLTGLTLAIFKRFRKKTFGLKRTTKLRTGDQIALSALWFVFPLRLLAESATAATAYNGSFLTNGIGYLMSGLPVIHYTQISLWWAYSLTLCIFFVFLPHSRYTHIPTEILYILLKNAGIHLKKRTNTYTNIQVFSCSRCGICLDNCQLSTAGINDSQSVYLLKNIRNNQLDDEQLFNCLLCGKCQIDCPVGINIIDLRITQRIESTMQYNSSYDYLRNGTTPKTDIAYFAGCMTHLTPSIIRSMLLIFEQSGHRYLFIDKDKAPCCGRPLMLAGQYGAASKLIENNSRKIIDSGAKTLVVSCPICYKVFKEDYHLPNVRILFHLEYIQELIKEGKLKLLKNLQKIIYHDPCELGRGSGIYELPRQLLDLTGSVIPVLNEKEMSYCCGGSLGNLKITQSERDMIRNYAIDEYMLFKPDILATACPLCKKTFTRSKGVRVLDIAEIIIMNMDFEFHEKIPEPVKELEEIN